MPSSAVRTFTDPDEYAAAMQHGTVGLTLTQRGTFSARLYRIELRRLWMQRFSANLGWSARIDYWGGRVAIAFQTRPGPGMTRNGRECDSASITRLSAGESYYLRAPGPPSYGTISVPIDEVVSHGAAVDGCDQTPPKDYLILNPPPSALAKLRQLHEAAGHLAENSPEIIASPDAARGLEQELIEAMLACLSNREPPRKSLAQGQHEIVMRRFSRVVEEHPEQSLYIPEICKAIRVSSRTLQACCHEHLGMGPKHYLVLRRMNLARWALRQSAPETASVTEIATRFGFWQLGRFAVEYQSLFGESPSATLGRQFT
jgi:AraC-like DNA-binding protein